ncbi:unnamed protein product [Lepidochelys olivacea]
MVRPRPRGRWEAGGLCTFFPYYLTVREEASGIGEDLGAASLPSSPPAPLHGGLWDSSSRLRCAAPPPRRTRFSGEPLPSPWLHEAGGGGGGEAAAAGLRRQRSSLRRWSRRFGE